MPYTKIIGVCLVTLFFVSCDLERDNPLDMNKGNKEIVLSFDSLVVVTDNNNDKQINKGESIKLTVVLKNNGSSSANKVRGTISCANSYISALSPTTSTPYYRNGVTSNDYIDAGGVGYGFSNLSFNVSSTTPAGTVIPFSIAITDESNNTWSDSFTITVVATSSSIGFSSFAVVTDNNNDKQINKGESIKLTVVLKNNGSSSANKVRGTISCANSYISALSPTTSTPYYRNGVTSNDYIDAGGVGYGFSNLSFNVSSTTPAGTVIPFSIAITDESNNTWSDSFTITIVATAELPNDVCNISSTTTGTTFIVISPSQQIFRYGDNYTITLSSETFSFGQATSVDLYRNETLTYSYGTFLLFDNNSRTFSLPNSIPASRCYTFRILTGSDIYITNSFTVH